MGACPGSELVGLTNHPATTVALINATGPRLKNVHGLESGLKKRIIHPYYVKHGHPNANKRRADARLEVADT